VIDYRRLLRPPSPTNPVWRDRGVAGLVVKAEFFDSAAPPPSSPLYIGADGESVIRLGARTAAQLYLGANTLF
jgi:hypothetical protein